MRYLFRFLLSLVLGLVLTSCTDEAWHPPMVRPDTVRVPAGTTIAKLKAGTVILQAGTGNVATTVTKARAPVATGMSKAQDFTRAGQHGGGLATEPGATVDVTNRTGIPPWLILVGLLVVVLIVFRRWLLPLL
jgi:hypothetical protein